MRPNNDLFWINGPIVAIEAAYINGCRVNGPFADYATALNLSIATIPAGSCATCLAEGALSFGVNTMSNRRMINRP